jgi:hypothetical protein
VQTTWQLCKQYTARPISKRSEKDMDTQGLYTNMFLDALFMEAKSADNVHQTMSIKIWYIHTMKNYLAKKMKY